MAMVRVLLGFLMAGALLGVVVASLVYPQYLVWNNTTASANSNCNCADVTRQTTQWLIHGQLVGASVGAVIGLGAGIAFEVLRRKKKAAAAPVAPAPPQPPAKA